MGRHVLRVLFRSSFHGRVRTLLCHLANTIGRWRGRPCCSPPWLGVASANRWRWLRRGRSRGEQNRVAIQRRLWAVTVSQSEKLNHRLPAGGSRLFRGPRLPWIAGRSAEKRVWSSGWASLDTSCYTTLVKCVNRRANSRTNDDTLLLVYNPLTKSDVRDARAGSWKPQWSRGLMSSPTLRRFKVQTPETSVQTSIKNGYTLRPSIFISVNPLGKCNEGLE